MHGLLSNKNMRIPTKYKIGYSPALCYIWADKGGIFRSCPRVPKIWVWLMRGNWDMFEGDSADTCGEERGHLSVWAEFWIIATIHSNFSGDTACIVRCYHRTQWKIFNTIISALAELWQAIGQLHTDWIQNTYQGFILSDFFKNLPLDMHEMSQSGKYFIICLQHI